MKEADNGATAPQEVVYGLLSKDIVPNLERRPDFLRPLTYEHFDVDPVNRDVNQRLLLQMVSPADKDGLILDVGCANGANSQMLVEAYTQQGIPVHWAGIDLDQAAIDTARQKVTETHLVDVNFMKGDVTNLHIIGNGKARKIFFTGIYHELQGKDEEGKPLKAKALEELLRVLEPGGELILVSAFTRESFNVRQNKEGEQVFDRGEFMRVARIRSAAMQKLNRQGDKNKTNFEVLTNDQVIENLLAAGFEVDPHVVMERANLTMESHRAIAEDKMYIKGAFQDMQDAEKVDMYSKREAYQQALDDAEAEHEGIIAKLLAKDPQAEMPELTYPRNISLFRARKPLTPLTAAESVPLAA